MKNGYCLVALIMLIGSSMVLTASCQEQVAWTVSVHEGNLNGTTLSDVQVTGQDASGNSFQGVTDTKGAMVINGQPGTWQFSFTKEGYEPLSLNYSIAETGEGAIYLQKTVAWTVSVHEGNLNGTTLSDVQVTGQDAASNSFQGITDSKGAMVINGQPGTWQFSFTKEGYDPLSLNYNVTDTGEGAVYLQKTAQS